jgi:DNA-binding transcriptional regulator/RsmH inhibitor MraZ
MPTYKGTMELTIDKAGRIVIPKSVRDDLGSRRATYWSLTAKAMFCT